MILYHGSHVDAVEPKILVSRRNLDFGSGFYTISSEEEAEMWAKSQYKRRHKGKATVTVYDFDEKCLDEIKVLRFEGPTEAWLDHVAENRKGLYKGDKYDLIIGPVANDNTMRVISDYIEESIDKETALILLKPQKLNDQYAFLTTRGLKLLKTVEVNFYD